MRGSARENTAALFATDSPDTVGVGSAVRPVGFTHSPHHWFAAVRSATRLGHPRVGALPRRFRSRRAEQRRPERGGGTPTIREPRTDTSRTAPLVPRPHSSKPFPEMKRSSRGIRDGHAQATFVGASVEEIERRARGRAATRRSRGRCCRNRPSKLLFAFTVGLLGRTRLPAALLWVRCLLQFR